MSSLLCQSNTTATPLPNRYQIVTKSLPIRYQFVAEQRILTIVLGKSTGELGFEGIFYRLQLYCGDVATANSVAAYDQDTLHRRCSIIGLALPIYAEELQKKRLSRFLFLVSKKQPRR
jgi:hypothetical protein